MRWHNLARRIDSVREAAAGAAGMPVPRRVGDAAQELGAALRLIEDLRDHLFELQEQNQQLRRDLADRVCPRLCARPYRSAT